MAELAELLELAGVLDLAVLPEDDEALPEVCPEVPADRSTVMACAAPGMVAPMPSAARTLAAPAATVTDRSLAWLRFRAATAARLERLSPPRLELCDAGIMSLSVCAPAAGLSSQHRG
ncbi:MAG TPA: hypothetical protein VEJ42_09625 [Streptosporangiaceae bacterium]|nr:hypothetical protein [Streptosporangiaceae bacterium]